EYSEEAAGVKIPDPNPAVVAARGELPITGDRDRVAPRGNGAQLAPLGRLPDGNATPRAAGLTHTRHEQASVAGELHRKHLRPHVDGTLHRAVAHIPDV